jgi:hypothetical protein
MSVNAQQGGNTTTRRSKAQHARRYYLITAAVAVSLAVIAASWWMTPQYRATMGFALDGRTFPIQEGRDARSQVEAFLQTLHNGAAGSSQRADGTGLEIVDVSTGASSSPELVSVSATFDVYVDRTDAGVGERAAEVLAGAYVEKFHGATILPPVSTADLEEARTDLAMAAADLGRAEQVLAAFEHENALMLPGLEDVRAHIVEESRQQRAVVDQQLRTLEIRRNELDRALAEMQRGASRFGSLDDSALTGEIFSAAQARWAALRGLHGEDYAPAVELGAALSDARATADARLASISTEFAEARERFVTLQATHPLDHPDVIGLAHQVSALERVYEQTEVAALSSPDLRYIEGLGRERREIDLEIDAARERRALLETQQGEQARLAELAPRMTERHLILQDELADAGRRHDSAEAFYASLQDELQAASHEQSGELSVTSETQVSRAVITRTAVVTALICVLCFLAFLLLLRRIEHRHRAVSGPNMIIRLQGRPPLAQIPELGTG